MKNTQNYIQSIQCCTLLVSSLLALQFACPLAKLGIGEYHQSEAQPLQRGLCLRVLHVNTAAEGWGGLCQAKEGSKTTERARRAEAYIPQEIDDMCFIIRTMADLDPDGYTRVTFGDLFDRYVRISYKVVGILMRARKPVFAYLSVCMYNDLFHLIILCK